MHILSAINCYFLGPVLPFLLLGSGIYFAFRLHGQPLRSPRSMLRVFFTRQSDDGVSPFRAVTVALAGTLGVGNIAGVATSIALGGPGAVFWMWISALSAMIVKYAEIVLAMRHRKMTNNTMHGGAMYYMQNRGTAIAFAVLCAATAFPLGNIVQIRAATDAITSIFPIPGWLCGVILGILIFTVVFGGVKGISDVTVSLIPFFSLLYIAFSLFIIVTNASLLPAVFRSIIVGAFRTDAAAGGVLGYLISLTMRSDAVRLGVTRGILSNEAGCGTAPIAHAAANSKSPAEQGFWGVFEVFADTIVLCSMTAFVILLFPESLSFGGESGIGIALYAFAKGAGNIARVILCVSILFFAFASAVCWAYYGLESLYFLTDTRNSRFLYLLAYSGISIYASVAAADIIWETADFAIGAMTLLNLCCLCAHHREIESETECYFGRPHHAEKKPHHSTFSKRKTKKTAA